MKLLVDVTRLETEGVISPEQAVVIRRIAGTETTALGINVITVLGVITVAGGVAALAPNPLLIAALGVMLGAVGMVIRLGAKSGVDFLGSALVFIGTLIHVGAVGVLAEGNTGSLAYAVAAFLLVGAVLRNRFLVALAAVCVAGLLGSSTGYSHAAYALGVDQPSFTILFFTVLAVVSYVLARRVPETYQDLPRVFGMLSVIWVNLGFWIGSLWGDDPGSGWAKAQSVADPFHIPDIVFAVVWAVVLVAVGALGAARNQRGIVNAAATFGAIHLYTQWFERLDFAPWMLIAAGLVAVGIAFVLWRYNQPGARWPVATPA